MDHIAILKRTFLEKILSGEKTVESRWSKTRRTPFVKVHVGDTIYMKYSGGPVVAKANVIKVEYYADLDWKKIEGVLKRHGKQIGVENSKKFFKEVRDKKYCSLFWLDEVKLVDNFNIDKTGYGNQAAWIVISNVENLKI